MILIIRQRATPKQIEQMAEIYFGLWIKLAVDINRQILAGGGELHYDCEQILLEDGSLQPDINLSGFYRCLDYYNKQTKTLNS